MFPRDFCSLTLGQVLWTDIGKIIGRQGMNLKIIKARAADFSALPWPIGLSGLRPRLAAKSMSRETPRQARAGGFCVLLWMRLSRMERGRMPKMQRARARARKAWASWLSARRDHQV